MPAKNRSQRIVESLGAALGAFHQIMVKPISETEVEVSTGLRGRSVRMSHDDFCEFLAPYATAKTRPTLLEAAGRKDTLFMFCNNEQLDRINQRTREVI